jgi:FecR protein
MRSVKALFASLLFILLAWPCTSQIARAEDNVREEEADEYDVTARVVRTSLLKGEVTLRRKGSLQWERATLNLPLVEGDTLATASDARLEIQIDARNFIRVGADSVLRIVTLRDDGIALSLAQGTATLRLAHFDREKEYFEIDAPKTTLSAERPGLYRLDVTREGKVRLTVRDGGRARIYSETSGFTLREERSAELIDSGAEEGDWQLTAASSFDAWDTWVDERERYLASRLRYEQRERYYDQDIWGAEELDAYGDWVYAPEYGGWVWRPHASAVNSYPNWAPYRYGQWRWCPPYGWTWIADEPWGWAPYHYGRWVYVNNSWCWAPRGYGYRYRRSWWRPALVAFVYVPTSYGEHLAWYPLRHGQRDPYRRNRSRRDERLTPLRANERDNLRRVNPAYARAVTSVPARDFGSQVARLRPAAADIAQRAIAAEPVGARLPISPTETGQTGAGDRERRAGVLPARPPSVVPAAGVPERPTGAAVRQPGAPLDEELQRTRLYDGRAPRPAASPANPVADPADRSTGAVERPARPVSRPRPEPDTGATDPGFSNDVPARERPSRPARPRNPDAPVRRPPASTEGNIPPREREPSRPRAPVTERPRPEQPRPEAPRPPERTIPAEPERTVPAEPQERPEPVERAPARPERPLPVERDEPTDRPVRRHERPEAPRLQPEPARVQPERPEPQPEPQRVEPARPEPQPVRPEPQPVRPEPQPEAPRVEPARPEPRPEPPAPRHEEPPAPREEPARREDPPPAPSSPPPSYEPSPPPPPPPPAPDPPRSDPPPAPREEAPSRGPEEDRARPPQD